MTTSPDACVLAAAVEAARELAARYEVVVARVDDPDVFLDPSWLPHRAPRNSVEFFVGGEGVVTVVTVQGQKEPLWWRHAPLPKDASALSVRWLRGLMYAHAKYGMELLGQQVAPRAHGLFGP